ncbi:hypothetical protein [Xylanimonas ulmi]|uniref:Uncharacterized protein n=1 Tax=Xylanimonas ulmi TaxID=228973 RepID=A0A4Q7M675_9MICO|nr:hypothetical protein [Xylanibacterium ulmi]RZS62537.1 hypothetical protein EV386_2873 [Xylanibacterium ulmi]
MARHGRSGGLTFELVPDDDADGPGPVLALAAPDPTPPSIPPSMLTTAVRRALGWLRSRSRPQLVAGGVVLALAVGAAGAAAVLRDREREATLRAAPGGVADLSQPIHERWSSTIGGEEAGAGLWPIAALGDVVVLAETRGDLDGPPSLAARDGRESRTVLHGLDLDTGAERWQAPLDAEASCGTGPGDLGQSRLTIGRVTQVVCVVGAGQDATVAVVDADGQVTTRVPDGLDEHTTLLPGPRGTLVRVRQLGDPPEGVELVVDTAMGWRLNHEFQPPDVQVSAEDALTGEARWDTRIEADVVDEGSNWWSCTTWDGAGEPRFDGRTVAASTADQGMRLWMCGVDVVLTASGRVAHQHPVGEASFAGMLMVSALTDGGLGISVSADGGWDGRTSSTVVVGDDGGEVMRLPGGVLDPWATDGTGGVVVGGEGAQGAGVIVMRDATSLIGVGADGAQRWAVPDRPRSEGALVRAAGVMLLAGGSGEMWAVDLGTGETRWTAPLPGVPGSGGTWGYARGAWTDGTVAVLRTPGAADGAEPTAWTAYDLRTGAVVWRLDGADADALVPSQSECAAVAGRLLCSDGSTLVRVA